MATQSPRQTHGTRGEVPRKALAVLLSATLSLQGFPAQSVAYALGEEADGACADVIVQSSNDPITEDGFRYKVVTNGGDPSTVTITGYEGAATELVIPAAIDGLTVTAIDDYAFLSHTSLTSVEIPAAASSHVGSQAFRDCTSLKTATFQGDVECFGVPGNTGSNAMFYGCTALESVFFAGSVNKFESNCFSYAPALTEIVVAGSVGTVGALAFSSFDTLQTFSAGSAIASVERYAFSGCTSLVSVPAIAGSVGDSAFSGCSSLAPSLYVGGTVGEYAFSGCTSLAEVTLGEGATSIGMHAFQNCTSMTSISLPDELESIDKGAFSGCTSLASVTIPAAASDHVGDFAFRECTSLLSATFLGDVTRFGALDNTWGSNALFYGCTALEEVTFAGSVGEFAPQCFSWVPALKSVVVAGTVGDIGAYVFSGLQNLETFSAESITGSVGNYAFYDCTKLTSVPAVAGTLGDSVFDNCSKLPYVTVLKGVNPYDDFSLEVFSGWNKPTVRCYKNSAAHMWAQQHSYGIILIDEDFDVSHAKVSAIANKTYTGSAIEPVVTVTLDYKELVAGTDYDVAYANNVDAGEATVTVTGKGSYYNSCSATFTIAPASIEGATIAPIDDQTHTGSAIEPAVTVTLGQKELVAGTDYTVAYKNNVDVGTATVTVTGKGNYAGEVAATFVIVEPQGPELIDIATAEVKLPCTEFFYDGGEHEPVVTVTYNGEPLVAGTDYELSGDLKATDAGDYEIIITGKGAFTGETTAAFTILKGEPTLKAPDEITVSVGGTQAIGTSFNGDAVLEYASADESVATVSGEGVLTGVSAGSTTVTITAPETSNWLEVSFEVAVTVVSNEIDINDLDIELGEEDLVYDGTKQSPTITVRDGETVLQDGVDYVLSGDTSAVNAGEYVLVITGIGSYGGEATAGWSIDRKTATIEISDAQKTYGEDDPKFVVAVTGLVGSDSIEYTIKREPGEGVGSYLIFAVGEAEQGNYYVECAEGELEILPKTKGITLSLSSTTFTYNGSVQKPTVTVKDGTKVLKSGTDYTVKWPSGCKNAKTYTVQVILDGNYAGILTKDFVIASKKLSSSALSFSATSFTYNGKVQKPTVTVKDGSTTLKTGTDYTVTWPPGCKNAGSYKVKVSLRGNYTGTLSKTYTIKPKPAKVTLTLSSTSFVYSGAQRRPTLTVKRDGTKITSSGYTVTWPKESKLVGTYKVSVSLTGNYAGTASATYSIVPAATSLTSLVGKKKSFTATWKRAIGAPTGYELQFSTTSSFKTPMTVKIANAATVTKTVNSLKSKATYYVRIRAYQKSGSTTYYSAWSKAMSVATK